MSITWLEILLFAFLIVLIMLLVKIIRMKKCPHCGRRINRSATVCQFCGKDLA